MLESCQGTSKLSVDSFMASRDRVVPQKSDFCQKNMPKSTRWHLVTVEIQKRDFLNNQERYEHTVLFCLKVLFQSIFNHKVNDF